MRLIFLCLKLDIGNLMASTHVSLDCPRVCAPPQRGLKCCTHVWGRHGVQEAHLTGCEPFAEVPVFPVSFCKMSLWYRKWPEAGGGRREAGNTEVMEGVVMELGNAGWHLISLLLAV